MCVIKFYIKHDKENIARKPTQTFEVTQWCVLSSQSAVGRLGKPSHCERSPVHSSRAYIGWDDHIYLCLIFVFEDTL